MPYSKVLARDVMNDNPPYCQLETSVDEISNRFAQEGLTGMLVVDDEMRLLGVISENDLIDQQKNLHLPTAIALFDMVIPMGEAQFEEELARMQAMTAEDLVNEDVTTVNVDTDLNEIASIMGDKSVAHLPVLDGGSVVGMICKHDVIKALVAVKTER